MAAGTATINEILKSYQNSKLIPFIGAGFPKNIERFPAWTDFVNKDLAGELRKLPGADLLSGKKLSEMFGGGSAGNIKATEYYIYKKGRHRLKLKYSSARLEEQSWEKIVEAGKAELANLLQRKFGNIELRMGDNECEKNWKAYIEFIKLDNFPTIYTTNWDPTLEEVSEKILPIDKKYELTCTVDKLRECIINRKRPIIYYHGYFAELDTIVATESDYFQRLMAKHFFEVKFHHDLLHYDFLFIGFSFEDWFVSYILYQANQSMREVPLKNLPSVFLVSIGSPNKTRDEYFELAGIKTYNICEVGGCDLVNKKKECKEKRSRVKPCTRRFFIEFFEQLKK
jgi:hypothetical protein